MLEITGTYQDGVFVPDEPVELPEGAKARIHVNEPEADEPFHMMREEDWPTTPEGVAAHVRRMESFSPCQLTPDEEASYNAWKAEMKKYNIEAVRKQMGLTEWGGKIR